MEPADGGSEVVVRAPSRDGGAAGAAARQAAASARPGPLDKLLGRTAATFRRRMVAGTAVAVLALAGISAYFAWRQYDEATGSALKDLQARAASVGGIVDVLFGGDIELLETAASSTVVRSGDLPGMDGYFKRVQTSSGEAFSGGLAWVDRQGEVEAGGRRYPSPSTSRRASTSGG